MESSYWERFTRQSVSRRRLLASAGGTAAGAALLAACGNDSSDEGTGDKSGLVTTAVDTSSQAKAGGTSKYYLSADPNTLDPSFATAPLESAQRHVYSGLLQEKAGYLKATDFEIVPDLAESWEWSGDRLQLTLKLRPGVKWHNKPPVNGRAFEAEDAVFSWNRFARIGSARSSLANVVSPDAPVLSVSATDARTVVFKLQQPLSYLTSCLGTWITGMIRMFPKEADGQYEPRNDMIGTGPFVLANYQPSIGFTFKRNPEYWEKGRPHIEQVDMPIISEYAAALAQLKAGNIYTYAVRGEDALSIKREVPTLNLFQGIVTAQSQKTIFGWYPPGKSPFIDERVRQALSMSYDRDLWIDTFYNVTKFRSEGLPVETRWSSHLPVTLPGWWLDPQSKEFGPNAKYFQHDIPEAKKLLAAAGYPNGIDNITSTSLTGTQYGINHAKMLEVLEGMASEAGFQTKVQLLDYVTEFIPKYRDGKGAHEGWAYKIGAPIANEAVANLAFEYYSKGGINFFGFDVNGKGDHSGDPYIDTQIEKARAEIDNDRRRVIVHDIQRYLGKAMYGIRWPGGASGFDLAWPALQNFNVFQRDAREINYTMWLDDSQPPLKRA